MSSDSAIDKMIFGGRIPIQFELSHPETKADPEPFYLLAPRCGYLTLCIEKIKKHFQPDIPGEELQENEIWFEYNGRPLKWNHPIGVLYDSFASGYGLPWRVQVHTTGYPETQLIRCEGMAGVESYFVSQLKQANFVKHETTLVDGLQSEVDRKQLWLGVANDDYERFWRINRKLMTSKEGNWFKGAPYRLYVVKQRAIEDPLAPIEIVEQPFPVVQEDGTQTTLEQLLDTLELSKDSGELILHGVSAPLETPLQWLAEHLSYPDNLIHLVWITKD